MLISVDKVRNESSVNFVFVSESRFVISNPEKYTRMKKMELIEYSTTTSKNIFFKTEEI